MADRRIVLGVVGLPWFLKKKKGVGFAWNVTFAES